VGVRTKGNLLKSKKILPQGMERRRTNRRRWGEKKEGVTKKEEGDSGGNGSSEEKVGLPNLTIKRGKGVQTGKGKFKKRRLERGKQSPFIGARRGMVLRGTGGGGVLHADGSVVNPWGKRGKKGKRTGLSPFGR